MLRADTGRALIVRYNSGERNFSRRDVKERRVEVKEQIGRGRGLGIVRAESNRENGERGRISRAARFAHGETWEASRRGSILSSRGGVSEKATLKRQATSCMHPRGRG